MNLEKRHPKHEPRFSAKLTGYAIICKVLVVICFCEPYVLVQLWLQIDVQLSTF